MSSGGQRWLFFFLNNLIPLRISNFLHWFVCTYNIKTRIVLLIKGLHCNMTSFIIVSNSSGESRTSVVKKYESFKPGCEFRSLINLGRLTFITVFAKLGGQNLGGP